MHPFYGKLHLLPTSAPLQLLEIIQGGGESSWCWRHLPSDVHNRAGVANSPGILLWIRMSMHTFSLRFPAGLAAWSFLLPSFQAFSKVAGKYLGMQFE